MTRWKVTDPGGAESLFEADDDVDASEKHDLFACALAGCADAYGWTFTDLDTGRTIVAEDRRAAIDAALAEPGVHPRTDERVAELSDRWKPLLDRLAAGPDQDAGASKS